GDWVLVVDNELGAQEKRTPRRLSAVRVDQTAKTTTITWSEELTTHYLKEVTLYALRVSAAPFGNNAPSWYSLSPTLTNSDRKNPKAPFRDNWDDSGHSSFFLPTPDVATPP